MRHQAQDWHALGHVAQGTTRLHMFPHEMMCCTSCCLRYRWLLVRVCCSVTSAGTDCTRWCAAIRIGLDCYGMTPRAKCLDLRGARARQHCALTSRLCDRQVRYSPPSWQSLVGPEHMGALTSRERLASEICLAAAPCWLAKWPTLMRCAHCPLPGAELAANPTSRSVALAVARPQALEIEATVACLGAQ